MIDEDIKSTIKAELESLPTVVQNAILHSGWQKGASHWKEVQSTHRSDRRTRKPDIHYHAWVR